MLGLVLDDDNNYNKQKESRAAEKCMRVTRFVIVTYAN